jgi:L-threonylcarbamoyladenylate synthase
MTLLSSLRGSAHRLLVEIGRRVVDERPQREHVARQECDAEEHPRPRDRPEDVEASAEDDRGQRDEQQVSDDGRHRVRGCRLPDAACERVEIHTSRCGVSGIRLVANSNTTLFLVSPELLTMVADDPPGSDEHAVVDEAAAAIQAGDLVVYPTETVYGLGADALNPDAVERAFDAKGRDRSKPLSMGVPSVAAAREHVFADERTVAFMQAFLPGPVTVLCERADHVPDVLVAGADRVGVRVPAHDLALAFFDAAGTPVTATSANRSGEASVRHPDELDPGFLEAVSTVLDGGHTDGAESTVVDPRTGETLRRGALAGAIEAWLDAN